MVSNFQWVLSHQLDVVLLIQQCHALPKRLSPEGVGH
jgi:hypothetical protein